MNIFVLDEQPELAALYHCDKHVVKMVLESTQILSTVMHIKGMNKTSCKPPYKPTHVNHPCVKWASLSKGNYLWLFNLYVYLLKEYNYRYGKVHKCYNYIPIFISAQEMMYFDNEMITSFVQVMPEKYRIKYSPVSAYRNYYLAEKSKFAKWTKREKPIWWIK